MCRTCGAILEALAGEPPQAVKNEPSSHEDDNAHEATSVKQDSWTCSHCGQSVPGGFEVCWNCGTSQGGVADPGFSKEAATNNGDPLAQGTDCPHCRIIWYRKSHRPRLKVRPTSVTVIAWYLIVIGVIVLFMNSLLVIDSEDPIAYGPIPIGYFMVFVEPLVIIVSGVGMLKKQNWARLLYVIWQIAVSFLVITISSMKLETMIPGIGVFLVVVFFLFRPKANQYFLGTKATNGLQDNKPTPQDIVNPHESPSQPSDPPSQNG
jgi:hypothetical protein